MSYTLTIGAEAPNFELIGTDRKNYSLKHFKNAKLLVIFFTCNHCPYVIGSDEDTRQIVEKFSEEEVQFVAINSNSANTYPEDSFERMIFRMKEKKFPWIYLHDESQEVARKYGALKTPHFFLFNESRKLIYTGRAVDSPRDTSNIKERNLYEAITSYLEKGLVVNPLTNPIGCNIKWEGKDPKWMPPEACDLVPKNK